ncbi:MAG: hypothetical protein PWP54_643 [Thermosipho sp. (in: thermotogales)]|nr:hypothetical protein [Thermosipho sp. (in: thermotogales)]MDN5324606.1 hypothetical protein [Thermosipho sp. (in: thermotogales)]
MPQEVIIAMLGKPYTINKTVTETIVYEQRIYEKYNAQIGMNWPYLYLYFENGFLVSWQKTE